MKHALDTCLLALNPNSPQPTAGVVKIDRGALWAYGGTFCIRIPVSVEIGAAFNPRAVLPFFRKDRKSFSATVTKGKLILKDGKETLSTRCLSTDELVVLDTLASPVPCTLDLSALKIAASIVDPAHAKLCAQGIQFRHGALESTDNKRLFAAASGIPDDLPVFNLPVESAKALMRMKSPVVGVTVEQSVVKFTLQDSSSLASNLICEELVDMSAIFGEDTDWAPLGISEKVLADLAGIDRSFVTVRHGNIGYTTVDDSGEILVEGQLTTHPDKELAMKVRKEFFNTALAVSTAFSIHRAGNLLKATGDSSVAVIGLITGK